MEQIQKKTNLVKKLASFQKSLNVQLLYGNPSSVESKDWLAGVAGILKNLDESDHSTFASYRQHIYQSIKQPVRKHAAEQIEAFIREKVAAYDNYDFESYETSTKNSMALYVKQPIIDGFAKKEGRFNYKKLVELINELNDNHLKSNKYSCAMLIRAILDHIPPLLGFTTFEQVTKNYSWGKTDKVYMKTLLEFRNNADDALHRIISEDEDLLEINDLPLSNRFSRVLQECIKKGSKVEFVMVKEISNKENLEISFKIKISLDEQGSQSWQNYSVSNYISYGYKFVLNIDNYNSSKPDYVWVYLKAKSNDDEWNGEHYVFEAQNASADTPYRVEAFEDKKVTVCVSDEQFNRGSRDHRFRPNIREETLVLFAKTKSGKAFELPIKKLYS